MLVQSVEAFSKCGIRNILKNVNVCLKPMSPLYVEIGEMDTITMIMTFYKFLRLFETTEASFFFFFSHDLVLTYIYLFIYFQVEPFLIIKLFCF